MIVNDFIVQGHLSSSVGYNNFKHDTFWCEMPLSLQTSHKWWLIFSWTFQVNNLICHINKAWDNITQLMLLIDFSFLLIKFYQVSTPFIFCVLASCLVPIIINVYSKIFYQPRYLCLLISLILSHVIDLPLCSLVFHYQHLCMCLLKCVFCYQNEQLHYMCYN